MGTEKWIRIVCCRKRKIKQDKKRVWVCCRKYSICDQFVSEAERGGNILSISFHVENWNTALCGSRGENEKMVHFCIRASLNSHTHKKMHIY
jgi:hypothetical protein